MFIRLTLLFLLMSVVVIPGCVETAEEKLVVDDENSSRENPVIVTVSGGSDFPAELAGLWKANDGRWEFMILPDGKIEYAVISMGRIKVPAGQKVTVPMLMDGVTVVEPGQWIVDYDYSTGILTVIIEIEHIYSEIGTGTIEGSSSDVFNGPVDIDKGVWTVDWTTFIDYESRTEQQEKELTTPSWGYSTELVFELVNADESK